MSSKRPDDRAIAARIHQARSAAGFSRAELGRRVGVGPSAAVQWESADGTAPAIENLAKIAVATGVSFEWLATGRGAARLRADVEEQSAVSEAPFARDLQEERVLYAFRKLDDTRRDAVVRFLEELAD